MAAERSRAELLEDRRRLVESLLQVTELMCTSASLQLHATGLVVQRCVQHRPAVAATACALPRVRVCARAPSPPRQHSHHPAPNSPPIECSCVQSHLSRGGRLELPIGASAAESWLLDAVDVPALLSALSRTPPGRLDLLTLCSSVTRYGALAQSWLRCRELPLIRHSLLAQSFLAQSLLAHSCCCRRNTCPPPLFFIPLLQCCSRPARG